MTTVRRIRILPKPFWLPLVLLFGLGVEAHAQVGPASAPATVVARIDAGTTYEPIDPLLYGHFVELFRHWFEAGVWAEMIGDRKFFHPVTNDPELDPPNTRSEFGVGRWWIVGPEERLSMDTAGAYVGTHSPRISLDPSEPHGIRQPGIGIRATRQYTGRVVLAGDPGARVHVDLVWGSGPGDRQTIALPPLSSEFTKYPLTFTAGADNPDGQIEIVGTGTGSFSVGAVSLMPADNVEGFNREVIEIVREMNPTMIRWGGNFSANYEWRDGIGDPDRRPPQYDFAWDAIESQDVGTFEILALNRLLGSEPDIGVNAALGDAYSAAQWVEYVNGSTDTPMGRLRAEHGHPEPFGVKWWGIGNEMYGNWQIGHMSIEHYIIKHNQFAKRMREVDPSIILVASGATPYQISADSRSDPVVEDGEVVMPPFEIGSRQDWSGQLLTHAYPNIDYVAEHIYGSQTMAYDGDTETWVRKPDMPLQDVLRWMPDRVKGAAEAWHDYREQMPWLRDTGIRLALDEWAAGGGEVERSLWVGLVLNEMFRNTDAYKMSAQTGFRRCFDHDRYHQPVLRACGLVFKMYTDHLGTVPVAVTGDSPQPDLPGTPGVDKPRESSGSPTYPLDVLAALSEDGSRLTVAVVNASESRHTLRLDVSGVAIETAGTQWSVAAPNLQAENLAGREPMIDLVETPVANSASALAVAPLSINVYEFAVRR